jgi:hypothetical protein
MTRQSTSPRLTPPWIQHVWLKEDFVMKVRLKEDFVMKVSADTIEIGNLKLVGFRSLTLLTTTLHPIF